MSRSGIFGGYGMASGQLVGRSPAQKARTISTFARARNRAEVEAFTLFDMPAHPNPRQDRHEERAISLLEQVIDIDRCNRDALPGTVVGLVKRAVVVLKKRRRRRGQV